MIVTRWVVDHPYPYDDRLSGRDDDNEALMTIDHPYDVD